MAGKIKGQTSIRCLRKDLPVPMTLQSVAKSHVKSESPDIGEGYRLINQSVDVPQDGDEYHYITEGWHPRPAGSRHWDSKCLYRRKIEPVKPAPERVPVHLYIDAGTDEVYAYLHPRKTDQDLRLYSDGSGGWYVEKDAETPC